MCLRSDEPDIEKIVLQLGSFQDDRLHFNFQGIYNRGLNELPKAADSRPSSLTERPRLRGEGLRDWVDS